jgi:septin family protein
MNKINKIKRDQNFQVTILVLGASKVGKTSFIQKFENKTSHYESYGRLLGPIS